MAKRPGSGGEDEGRAVPPEGPDYKDAVWLSAFLLAAMRKVNRPLRMDELLRVTHLPRKAKKSMEAALHALQREGLAVRTSGGWTSQARARYAEGALSVLPSGTAFVTPEHGGPDIYIHPEAMNGAWHGDMVEALLLPGKRGPHVEGRVTKVLRRSRAELPARTLRLQKDGLWMCAPENPRLRVLFVTDVSGLNRPVAEGDLLLLRPGEKVGANLWRAEASLNLECAESPAAQEYCIKNHHGIPGPFPDSVLAAVRGLPADPQGSDFSQRRDACDIPFVTIDGPTARDFDDAIHVEARKDGFRLRVAIADVSHYVLRDSPLDREARQRGNSYYFPLSVEPMLPEALSNGLCSLNPGVPRLVMVADLRFSASGERSGAAFYPAVIQSRARLTYGQIRQALLLREAKAEQQLAAVLPMLREAERLAHSLLERRQKRGSLDFDLPEASYLFSEQGELCGVAASERHFGHRIIEECMIAANEAVAAFLEARRVPTLYRVHQPPDPGKLRTLTDFLVRSGLAAPDSPDGARGKKAAVGKKKQSRAGAVPTGRDLRRMLEQSQGTPSEYVVSRLILRSMMQARYQPENEGHFGLAADCYCHFTSPIRRYADLTVHRALKRALGLPAREGEEPFSQAQLETVAEHINGTEWIAAEAERDMHKRFSALFLRGREGESFAGVISRLTDFGIFVELPQFMAEGMIRLAALDDDYYDYVEEHREIRGRRTGRTFRLGQSMRVLLTAVNLSRSEINFIPENPANRRFSGGTRAGGSRGKRRV